MQVLPVSAGVLAGYSGAFCSFSFDEEPTVEAVAMDNLRGTSVLEGAQDLPAYASAFDLLRSSALAPDASAKLIRGRTAEPQGRNIVTEVVSPFWKSSYSGAENACVEVADTAADGRAVRDSKHRADAHLTISPESWTAFLGQFR